MENVIVYLVRNDWRDIVDLNECFVSICENIPETVLEADILIFHEPGFEMFIEEIKVPPIISHRIEFVEIDLGIPEEFQSQTVFEIPEYVPHPTHTNGPIAFGHPGFSIGYRSMCRFFGAKVFLHEKIVKYDYLMRLDTDSRFHKGNGESLFGWANRNDITYGYIQSAIQWDHHDLIPGLKFYTLRYFLRTKRLVAFLKAVSTRRGRVYYTNFEIAKVSYFASEEWQDYFNYLDKKGGFYTKRWGDHILRFIGVNSLVRKSERLSLPPGFTYQHGGLFESGARQSFRPYWLSR